MHFFNSTESYAAAMNQVRALELKVDAAEKGSPDIDFQKDVQSVRELRETALTQNKQGKISFFSRTEHRELERALEDLTKRIAQVSHSRLRAPQTDSYEQDLFWKRVIFGAGLFTAALAFAFSGQSNIAPPIVPKSSNPISPTTQDPDPQADPLQNPVLVVVPQNVISPRLESSPNLMLENAQVPLNEKERALDLSLKEILEVSSGLPSIANPNYALLEPDRNISASLVAFQKKLQSDLVHNCSAVVKTDPLVLKKIGVAAENLVHLGALLLAGNALQRATPFFCLIAANRLYKLARLSNTTLINDIAPERADDLRKAAEAFDRFEASFPLPTSKMLQNMKSLDRWATVELLRQLPNVPGIRQAGAAFPGGFLFSYAWPFLQYAPFFVNTQGPDEGMPVEGESRLVPRMAEPVDDPIKDLAAAVYLILAGHALGAAHPAIVLSATHQVYTILKESDTRELKKTLPLFASMIEKASHAYESAESYLPFSTANVLFRLTDLDRWAMIGLMNIVRNQCKDRIVNMRIPVISWLLADAAWRFVKFTPLLLGSGLSWLNSAIGFNPQMLSSVDSSNQITAKAEISPSG